MKPRLGPVLSLAVTGTLLMTPAVVAGEWSTAAGVAVSTFYSDNICLSDLNKQGEWVGTARPDISLQGRGGRLNLNLRASVEANTLGASNIDCGAGRGRNLGNRESVVPRVSFNSDLELIQDWLTLEATANAAQNPINPFAAGGDDAINARENTNITYRYGVGARSQRRIGDRGIFQARYNYNEQYNAVRLLGDSSENSAQASLGTDPAAVRLSVGINGTYRKIEFEDAGIGPGFDNEFATVAATVGLSLNRSFQLNATAGEEFNEFLSAVDEVDGTYWDAGVTWTPNSRVRVSAGYGERFFGTTPRLNINYRHKRSTFSAAYQRTISLPRDLRGRFNQPEDQLADIEDLPGDPLGGAGANTFVGRGPVENESFTLNWAFKGRRSGIGVSASESQQTRLATETAAATFRNISVTLRRSLGRHLSTDARIGWREREGGDDSLGVFGQRLEAWTASWGVSRRIGNDTTLTARYQYTDQTAGNNFNTFTENRVTLSVRYQF